MEFRRVLFGSSHGGDHGRGRPQDAGARGGEADRCDSRREGHRHPRLRPHDAGREARRNPRCPQDDSLAKAMTETPLPETRVRFAHFLTIPTRWMDNDIYGHVNNVVYYSYFDTVINDYLIREGGLRSEEPTSELQSLMRISYAVFC